MALTGLSVTRDKELALANCNGLLLRTSDEVDELVDLGASRGLQVHEIERLGMLAGRLVQLRRRRCRIQEELIAIAAEWAE